MIRLNGMAKQHNLKLKSPFSLSKPNRSTLTKMAAMTSVPTHEPLSTLEIYIEVKFVVKIFIYQALVPVVLTSQGQD